MWTFPKKLYQQGYCENLSFEVPPWCFVMLMTGEDLRFCGGAWIFTGSFSISLVPSCGRLTMVFKEASLSLNSLLHCTLNTFFNITNLNPGVSHTGLISADNNRRIISYLCLYKYVSENRLLIWWQKECPDVVFLLQGLFLLHDCSELFKTVQVLCSSDVNTFMANRRWVLLVMPCRQ